MRTLEAHGRKVKAVRRARELQRAAARSTLVAVERDMWKEPYSYRVVSFDLNNKRDRSYITPIGTQRVSGVYPIFFARRLALILPPAPPPRVPNLIGTYKTKRRERRREKVAA